MNGMPAFVRALVAVLIEIPALVLWLASMYQSFISAWLFGEQGSAPDHLKLNWDWRQPLAWPFVAMSAGYLMLEFGGLLRGKHRLGKNPSHIARAVTLHWAAQLVALIAFSGGVACYHSAKRQAAGTTTFGVICGVALAGLILCFFLSHKWSRHYVFSPSGDDTEPG
jgi:hypothetical protein